MNASATNDSRTFIRNMMTRYKMMRKTVRTTSTSWLHTNVRMTSTSEVQRWMISPVEWAVCHEKLRCWMWSYSPSRIRLTNDSDPRESCVRWP